MSVNDKNNISVKPLALAVAAACASSGVIAQDSTVGSGVQTIEEVTVTATRRTQSILDVPINITAVSGETLDERGITDMARLAQSVPGIAYVDKGVRNGLANNSIVFRGLNATRSEVSSVPNLAVSPVATYVNDSPLFVNLRLKDIKSIEVLRGPQGTLYGSGSLGGTVRILQNKPDFDGFEARLDAGVTSPDDSDEIGFNVDGLVNIALSDTFAIRANVGREERAGFIDIPNRYARDANGIPVPSDPADVVGSSATVAPGKNVNDDEFTNARISARWAPNYAFDATFSFHYQETESSGTQQISPYLFGDDRTVGHVTDSPYEDETKLLSLEAEYDFGFATLTSSTTYYESEVRSQNDTTGLYTTFPFYAAYYGSSPRPTIDVTGVIDTDAVIQELRLVSNTGGKIDWIIGGFYQNEDSTKTEDDFFYGYDDYANACFAAGLPFGGPPCGYGTLFGIVPDIDGVPVVQDLAFVSYSVGEFRDYAVFGELTFHINDAWQVTGGIRAFDSDFENHQTGGLLFAGAISDITREFSDSGTLFKFNTSYDINENHMIYGTWSEGYRRGGANALPAVAVGEPTDPILFSYGPDIAENREVGLKGTLPNGMKYSFTYYNIDWEDVQLDAGLTPLAIIGVINAGEASTQGIELEVAGNVTENLNVNVGYSYTDATLDSLSPQALSAFLDLVVDEELPGTPKHAATLAATYSQQLRNGWELLYGVFGSFRGTAATTADISNGNTNPFTVFDLSLALNTDKWTVRAYANNVGDEIGITTRRIPSQWGAASEANIIRPRTLGLTFTYRYY